MKEIRYSQQGLAYKIEGDTKRPTLVMLHGLARSSKYWLGFDKKLAKKFCIVTVDVAGTGESKKALSWNVTVEDLAKDIHDLLCQLKSDQVHILGVSLGGMVGLALAMLEPKRVQTLMIMNSSVGGQKTPRITPKALKWLFLSALFPPFVPDFMTYVILSPNTSGQKKKTIAKKWRKIQKQEGLPKLEGAKLFFAAVRFQLKKPIKNDSFPPTLLILGEDDVFVPKINAHAMMKLLPRVKLIVVKKAGHEPFLEQSTKVEKILSAFIDEHSQATPLTLQ